ncbi:MAG: cytochrome c oxidase subunit II [Bacteroidetes bacterium]|nr:MAG: cytochrome c oxidase subunit II [Bacteroidota bacterium]
MVGIITALVIVLAIIALTQVVKVYETSSALEENRSNDVSHKDNNTQGRLFLAFGILFMASFVAMIWAWGDLTLGTPGSEHGADYDFLWDLSMGTIILVFVLVQPILFYFAYKYRGVKGRTATYYEHNNTLEFIWTIIPAVALAVLITFGLYTWSNVMTPDNSEQEPIVVEVFAEQFKWTARYSGEDNQLGYANVRFIEGANSLGIDKSDDKGFDDIVVRDGLVLPKGRPVLFKFRSKDIIHSAFMPHFRAQMNCVPGMSTQFQFTPSLTTAEMRQDAGIIEKVNRINAIRAEAGKDAYEFDYVLLCNKICGASHYNMRFPITVVTPEEYDEWISEQTTFAEAQ